AVPIVIRAAVSARRLEYPISLSYHAATDSNSPWIAVSGRSTIDECGSPTMRDDAHSSSRTDMTPFRGGTAAALRNASLTASTVTGRSVSRFSSAMLPVRVGTRYALPVMLRPGQMKASERAAPDEEGMMFSVAAHESRRSFIGWSVSDWVLVYAWIVENRPDLMPKFSITTLTTGASALVVQLAILTILCFSGSNVSRLMPVKSTASQSSRVFLGALTSTRFAPASRWAWAPERVLARPVQSITRSTPRALQSGRPFTESKYGISRPPTTNEPPFVVTSSAQRPQ